MILGLLLGIAFVTLFERHVLALSQSRKAPRKSGRMGVLQPIYDGIKLFKKEVFEVFYIFNMYYFGVPFLIFFVILIE
jgi:NADH-quinone oxidoreductase subunit H